MGQITADQSQQVMAALATNVDWGSIDFDALELQDAIIQNSKEAGAQFAAFLKNRARLVVGEPKSVPTKPFNPTEFLGNDWNVWKGLADGDGLLGEDDIDERSLALTEVQFASLSFETCLKEGESSIGGEEKLRRLKAKPNLIRLGGNVFLGLWLDYRANGEKSFLEALYRNRGITYLDFFGLVLRHPNGYRYVLYLSRSDDGRWRRSYNWLGNDWRVDYPSAVRASST